MPSLCWRQWLFNAGLLLLLIEGFAAKVNISISPNQEHIKKFIGEAVYMKCYLSAPKSEYFLYWTLPTNAQGRVQITKSKGEVSILLDALKETDSGKYTCRAHKQTKDGEMTTEQMNYINLTVLPRALPRRSCGPDSFYCSSIECIHEKYKCDGRKDCSNGRDEDMSLCGADPCVGKLKCERDDRCLSKKYCCRYKSESLPNCSITPNIHCCKQLIHPAELDPDLFYFLKKNNSYSLPKINFTAIHNHKPTSPLNVEPLPQYKPIDFGFNDHPAFRPTDFDFNNFPTYKPIDFDTSYSNVDSTYTYTYRYFGPGKISIITIVIVLKCLLFGYCGKRRKDNAAVAAVAASLQRQSQPPDNSASNDQRTLLTASSSPNNQQTDSNFVILMVETDTTDQGRSFHQEDPPPSYDQVSEPPPPPYSSLDVNPSKVGAMAQPSTHLAA